MWEYKWERAGCFSSACSHFTVLCHAGGVSVSGCCLGHLTSMHEAGATQAFCDKITEHVRAEVVAQLTFEKYG